MPGTGAWVVVAVNYPDEYPYADLRAAGPFESEQAAVGFAAELDDGAIDWRVTQLYDPERGVGEFSIGDR